MDSTHNTHFSCLTNETSLLGSGKCIWLLHWLGWCKNLIKLLAFLVAILWNCRCAFWNGSITIPPITKINETLKNPRFEIKSNWVFVYFVRDILKTFAAYMLHLCFSFCSVCFLYFTLFNLDLAFRFETNSGHSFFSSTITSSIRPLSHSLSLFHSLCFSFLLSFTRYLFDSFVFFLSMYTPISQATFWDYKRYVSIIFSRIRFLI